MTRVSVHARRRRQAGHGHEDPSNKRQATKGVCICARQAQHHDLVVRANAGIGQLGCASSVVQESCVLIWGTCLCTVQHGHVRVKPMFMHRGFVHV